MAEWKDFRDGNPVITGSIAISCEHEGEFYVAVCSRPREEMTMSGSITMFNTDGSQETPLQTGIHSASKLLGINLDDYPQKTTPALLTGDVRFPGNYDGEYLKDMSKAQPGFNGDPEIMQVGIDYATHLGSLESLPELKGQDTGAEAQDTKATWLNVKNVTLQQENGRTFYSYSKDDNENIPEGQEVLNIGGMNLVEPLIAMARDIPFREAGFDGIKGFIKFSSNQGKLFGKGMQKHVADRTIDESFQPVTQTGQKIADLYSAMGNALSRMSLREKH